MDLSWQIILLSFIGIIWNELDWTSWLDLISYFYFCLFFYVAIRMRWFLSILLSKHTLFITKSVLVSLPPSTILGWDSSNSTITVFSSSRDFNCEYANQNKDRWVLKLVNLSPDPARDVFRLEVLALPSWFLNCIKILHQCRSLNSA